MPAVILLPLDDRPVNRLFPVQLGKIAGLRLITPPRELLGSFTNPGDSDSLADWLLLNARRAQAAVVSIDMLCYGGLIASRTPEVSAKLALQRMNALRALRKMAPKLPIYASSVIMRLSITADTPKKVEYWRDVALYSQLTYRVERMGEDRWEDSLTTIRSRIPDEVLSAYLAARERNHTVNLEVVRLAGEGVLQQAILCQEDAAPIGPHIMEQQALLDLAEETQVSEKIFLHTGADEASLTLLTRAACDLYQKRPRVAVCYGSREGAERVALYEDRPIEENVLGHILASGAIPEKCLDDADLALIVHTPTGPQREVVRQDAETERRSIPQAERLAMRATDLMMDGTPVAVADLAYCNGADEVLIGALEGAGVTPLLSGYAGWNTAGNTIGTALAQGILFGLPEEELPAHRIANLNFIFERLVDDFLYQAVVRQEANEWAEVQGITPINLGDAKDTVEAFVKRRLAKLARLLFKNHLQDRLVADNMQIKKLRRLTISLPWPRTFEVEVKASIEVGPED